MKARWIGLALGVLVVVGAAVSLPSCGHDQKLVQLTINPSTFTFLTPAGNEQYTATGTYIHPPATKDVTSQATWAIDDGVITYTAPGNVTPTTGSCGGGTISATMPEGTGGSANVVIAYAIVIVDNPADPLCPGGGKVATLSVSVQGSGTVTSTPAGISCPATCSAQFNVGSSVLLTASPTAPAWGGCTSQSGTQCTVTIPTGGAAVIATFP